MYTLAGPATIEIEIKRSRFVAHAARVDSLAETLEFYEHAADPSATHNCWAWRLDHQYRFNDDGEPASTAGKPILSTIDGKGLDHVMVVVTRHYGGIKLGVGGLVRAYSGSAGQCIDQARILEVQPRMECAVQAQFGWTGQVYAALNACNARKLSEQYNDAGIEIHVEVAKSAFKKLRTLLRDTTRGEVTVRKRS
ncbi:MAG: YigZ family protein [Xanthomonadales bacterium]|nr:IMPACT family protein [Gammaproteobacteria bacterium]MBT8053247.1 IMPACT family protein [Gammaproteobacteria bacterium]NND56839.1 YigZ family protein [Xanthomonadales bacterium]NNK50287.1 YigZ family protein [Xanthomonadales bacterium]